MAQLQFNGEYLRQLREERGLFMKDVAAAVGYSAAAAGQWEAGKRNPSTAAAKKLADFFGVDSATLWVNPDATTFPHPRTQGDIVRCVAALTSTNVKTAAKLNEFTITIPYEPGSALCETLVTLCALENIYSNGKVRGAAWDAVVSDLLSRKLPELDKQRINNVQAGNGIIHPMGFAVWGDPDDDKEETPAPEE